MIHGACTDQEGYMSRKRNLSLDLESAQHCHSKATVPIELGGALGLEMGRDRGIILVGNQINNCQFLSNS
jgi:hypothetical protein